MPLAAFRAGPLETFPSIGVGWWPQYGKDRAGDRHEPPAAILEGRAPATAWFIIR